METTYNVRIWKTEIYRGKRTTTYWVRWCVAGKPRKESFKSSALADGFRSDLVSAARKGEAFDAATGLPVAMSRRRRDVPVYTLGCKFADLKWPYVAATTRRTHAEALTAITTATFTSGRRDEPDGKLMRRALCRWAFNTPRRNTPGQPGDVTGALLWAERYSIPVSGLTDASVLRNVVNSVKSRLDGNPAAPSVAYRRLRILNTLLEYAVELGALDENPLPELKRRKKVTTPRAAIVPVDRRSVANPVQVRCLLEAVRAQRPSGPRLVAFYGSLYFAALRPEEAVALKKHMLSLPREGWGKIYVEQPEPYAGKDWTDTGRNRDQRQQLKQREIGESRPVPCPPELTALFHEHIRQFGTGPDGRLFVGERNKEELPKLTITRTWKRARLEVFAEEVATTPLAATPYDLRHAAVSMWLNSGVPATDVAAWAGHSVDVLLRIYAKCLVGGEAVAQLRIQQGLGWRPDRPAGNFGTHSAQTPGDVQ
jgi:integrase